MIARVRVNEIDRVCTVFPHPLIKLMLLRYIDLVVGNDFHWSTFCDPSDRRDQGRDLGE